MTDVVMMFCTLIFTMALITTFVCRKELQKGQSYTFLSILVCICVCAGCSLVSNYIEDSYIATGTLFIIQYATQLILFLLCLRFTLCWLTVSHYIQRKSGQRCFLLR